jgi:hypothetical protein
MTRAYYRNHGRICPLRRNRGMAPQHKGELMKRTRHTLGLLGLAVLTVGGLSLMAQRPENQARGSDPMSGDYQLESTRGGNPQRAAETATHSLPPGQRDRAYQSLLSRLEPPQSLSIDRNGRTITIASSRGPRSAFDADGRTRSERGPNGQMVSTRAEIRGSQLTVSTSGGSRGSDFSVTFEALNNGTGLLVTRRLDDDDLQQPVTIQSYYRRTATTPRWDVYASGSGPGYDNRSDGLAAGILFVPDGTRMLATLDTPLSMRRSRDGEPFTMTVRSPAEFQGARIDGVISRVNAYRDNGNSEDIRVDFQTMQLRGRSFDFDAYLDTVRLADGTLLRVNGDGDVRDENRRDTTIQNGAIGAAIGAIIGSIAGGGKGAAVGALVGGTGGVILSQGHEQLDLQPGSEVTLTAVTRNRVP